MSATPEAMRSLRGYLAGVLAAMAASALALVGVHYLAVADMVMVYLVGVTAVAARFGLGPSVVSALLGVAGFDYLILPPTYAFSLAEVGHAVTLGGMIFVSILVSGLTERLRREQAHALRSEQRTQALYALERTLSGSGNRQELAAHAARQIERSSG
jgi:two-component system, OmpR family, sensor histidine kinase KdpD